MSRGEAAFASTTSIYNWPPNPARDRETAVGVIGFDISVTDAPSHGQRPLIHRGRSRGGSAQL